MHISPQALNAKEHFPFFHRIAKTLSGPWARRIYFAMFFLLLLISTAIWLRSYLLVRKIEAVLHGLSEIRLDQTTEEQLKKIVPYLTQRDWKAGGISYRSYYVHISNESDRLPRGPLDWLRYQYIGFDAGVLVQDGKVLQVEYGVDNQWVRPQYPGYTGYIVSARSVHGLWLPYQSGGLRVTSVDDYSPQYRPRREGNALYVIYTNDAPPELTKRVFHLNLSCLWGLPGCDDASDIAPEISADVKTIQESTYQQLISEKCPDSIIEGRMRYLPDISVLLLEVTGSRRIEVNEDGDKTEDWFTDYKLKEVIRGQNSGFWNNVRFHRTIPSPRDAAQMIANQIWPQTKIGSQVLFFGGPGFYSCRFVPATPSALEIVRNAPTPLKRPEDQIPRGLL